MQKSLHTQNPEYMKTVHCKLLVVALTLMSTHSFGQIDTTKIEQYCQLIAQNRAFSSKVNIYVNFGEDSNFLGGDTRLKDELTERVKKFNSTTDALNYMGQHGWSLVNAFPITVGGQDLYHFYFKKLFNKTDIKSDQNSKITQQSTGGLVQDRAKNTGGSIRLWRI